MLDFNSPYSLLIDGRLVDTAARLEVINPATGNVFAQCPAAAGAELDTAVAAARQAFPAWKALGFAARAACIARFAAALEANQEPLARLLTQEQGKPLGQSRDEIARAAALSVGITKIAINTEVILDNAERFIELRYQPLGVAGIITPWNAPVNLAAGPLASALYTGNCAIIKPSPFTPLTTLRIGEILREVLPAGVVSVLAGGDELGALMTAHRGIDKISFTGSVASGKKVMASSAGTLKRVTLELGGNDAAIVLADVDVADVAKKLFFAATVNSGQVCMAVKRIYAHESIYDALCSALAAEAGRAKLGDGLDPTTTLGPIQNRRQYERVCELKADAAHRGQVTRDQSVPEP
jgi:acyl-CoA reductase-like NAD-dependent aldehyde dehydrogenase